jgi:hypothetical protein
VAILGQQLAPHFDVTVLDRSQLSVDLGSARVPFSLGQLAIEKGGVGFVFEVVKPVVRRRGGRGGGHAGDDNSVNSEQ